MLYIPNPDNYNTVTTKCTVVEVLKYDLTFSFPSTTWVFTVAGKTFRVAWPHTP